MERVAHHQSATQTPPQSLPLPSPVAGSAKPSQQQQPKALRFVTNYGAPHPKRRRIGTACLTCRKRKTACSGERPHCETCTQNKLLCAGYSSETVAAVPGRKATDPAGSDVARRRSTEQAASKMQGGDVVEENIISPESATRHCSSNDSSRILSAGHCPRVEMGMPSLSDRHKCSEPNQESLFSGPRNRMPYFRWLGPTAIMPGFKQMVVKVTRTDAEGGCMRSSTDGGLPSPSLNTHIVNTPGAAESDTRTPPSLPFYDTSSVPPSELITHLANTFFSHLGCNYPFLQRERFMRDLEEKRVDAILVDAVCALAARFSTHSLLTQSGSNGEKGSPAEYGHAFAQRAKTNLTDIFPVPSVAAAQAALLLAYNEFGEQRDSGLWMYLGIAIRLAQDLGLHKLEGLRYLGKDGLTPKTIKQQLRDALRFSGGAAIPSKDKSAEHLSRECPEVHQPAPEELREMDESKAVEQERIDTFWAIFFLDRVISSGTGRRGTLRDKDIEISFPSLDRTHNGSDWPAPFPALIRIVHLYGRVADVLNGIKESSDITPETTKNLAAMESHVTASYQNLSPKLHFDAVNFQHYMKAGEGTNFVLLHFWFHTLIILLNQPILMMTFPGRMLQLFPNSQQLSMSSAKTIADILSYSQLMDAKASLGNPFTSQPIYIAACAFLRESAEQTATSNAQSRGSIPDHAWVRDDSTPSPTNGAAHDASNMASIGNVTTPNSSGSKSAMGSATEEKSQLAKHTLLATAATQHYQLCYKSLQSLEMYWAGTKYILTVLDQKFAGVGDPLMYTAEEAECSIQQPRPEPAFTSPGWRRRLSFGGYAANANMSSSFWPPGGFKQVPGSSPGGVDPTKAIGWTITGNMNSNSTNLAWHFAGNGEQNSSHDPRQASHDRSTREDTKVQTNVVHSSSYLQGKAIGSQQATAQDSVDRKHAEQKNSSHTKPSQADAESLLALSSSFSQHESTTPRTNDVPAGYHRSLYGHSQAPLSVSEADEQNHSGVTMEPPSYATPTAFIGGLPMGFMPGNMMIESQDVDMSMLELDMMPWFDSYPTTHDMMHLFDPHSHATSGVDERDGSGPQ